MFRISRPAASSAGVSDAGRILFVCFILSGFTGLLYQTVWMRLALASFGVNTSVISTVLTVFMLGLAIGTFLAGRTTERIERRFGLNGMHLYAAAEALIGLGGWLVPALFDKSRDILLGMGSADSLRYWIMSTACLSVVLLPFSMAMGCTFPTALSFLKKTAGGADGRYSFSFLYLANVLGALLGVLLPTLVLIELAGFRSTLRMAAFINFGIMFLALLAARTAIASSVSKEISTSILAHPDPVGHAHPEPVEGWAGQADDSPAAHDSRTILGALFLTGFCSMGMEVVWTRIYTPAIGTFVYSFAGILAVYLLATALGSLIYRYRIFKGGKDRPWASWHWLCVTSTFPLLTSSYYLDLSGPVRLILGLGPFCAILGFLTPLLIDRHAGSAPRPPESAAPQVPASPTPAGSAPPAPQVPASRISAPGASSVGVSDSDPTPAGNDPQRAAKAYGLNLAGCVLGPLLAGFVLIPRFGMRWASFLLVVPLFIFAALKPIRKERRLNDQGVILILSIFLFAVSMPPETLFPKENVKHDHTATVIATAGQDGYRLFINGVSITIMTPITKMMVHFPMAHLDPQRVPGRQAGTPTARGLVICLGMGTSFRSLMSWGGDATAVELVPSVPKFLSFFFPDAPAMMAERKGHAQIVVDDGRRFLDRSSVAFDLITLDPPPPVEAAASSLLYSKEFYQSAIRKLRPGGIVQTWIPGGDSATLHAVTRSLTEIFEYVRIYRSVERWGYHFMASQTPQPRLSAQDLLKRMPPAAVQDMTEWYSVPAVQYFERMLEGEVDPQQLMFPQGSAASPALTDDRPVNEFFFLRLRPWAVLTGN